MTSNSLDHRRIGVELYNATWTLLEQPDRTVAEDEEMLHMAHASAYHWRHADGATPNNHARSEWQVSRVYSVLGRPEPAGHHARRCLEICQFNGIGDWDIAFAYEALARAAAVGGDLAAARSWVAQAQAAAVDVAEEEERQLVLADLRTIPGLPSPG